MVETTALLVDNACRLRSKRGAADPRPAWVFDHQSDRHRLVQVGTCLFNDTKNHAILGIEQFKDSVDVENPYPISYVDQISLTAVTVDIATA